MGKSIYLKDNEKEVDKIVHECGNIYTDDNGNYYLLTSFDNYVFLVDIETGNVWSEHFSTEKTTINNFAWESVSGNCDFRLITNETVCIEIQTT